MITDSRCAFPRQHLAVAGHVSDGVVFMPQGTVSVLKAKATEETDADRPAVPFSTMTILSDAAWKADTQLLPMSTYGSTFLGAGVASGHHSPLMPPQTTSTLSRAAPCTAQAVEALKCGEDGMTRAGNLHAAFSFGSIHKRRRIVPKSFLRNESSRNYRALF